jgi:uncharacterized protein (TIRG00374 family)
MKKYAILKTVFVSSITIAIFYAIFTKIDFFSVVEVLSHSNLWYLFLAFLLTLSCLFITAKRWQIILQSMDYDIPYKECFFMIMGAMALISVTPSRAGDIIKSYYLKDKIPISKTIGSVLTERVLDVFSLALFSLIGMIFYKKFELTGVACIILFCIIVTFFISHLELKLPIKKSWNEKLQNMVLSMKTLTINKKAFSTVIVYSFSIWFLSIVQTLIFFYALGVNVPWLYIMANIPIAIFIGLIPITLGGMGTRDTAIIFLFSGYAEPSQLLGVGILFSIFRYWLVSLMGIPFMRKMIRKNNTR